MSSRKLHLVTDYNTEVLTYLLNRVRKIPGLDYTQQANPGIPVFLRNQAAQWLLDRSPELGLDAHTVQLAVTLLNIILVRMNCPKTVLQLVVVLCLNIAAKYQEGRNMTVEQVIEQAGGSYVGQEVIATELYMMQKLEWTLVYPTAAELGRQLVYVTGVEYNFDKILERSEAFESLCYADFSFMCFSPLAIAVVCVSFALEQFRQVQFRNQWLRLLSEKVHLVSFDEADRCKAVLLLKLYRETPENERRNLGLSEDKLKTLIGKA